MVNNHSIFTRESRMLRASLPSSGRPSVCLSVRPSVTLILPLLARIMWKRLQIGTYMLLKIYQHRWPWVTLNLPKRGFSEFFAQFCAATRISRVNCAKMEIDQDNLHMKFSAWNVDFSSPSPDPLDSSRPAHVGVNERYPCRKWLFILCWLV